MPFADYIDPAAEQPATPPATPDVGYGEDIGKGFVGGLGRGTAGALGIGGTVGGLIRSGLGYAGVPEDYLNKGAAVVRAMGNVVPQARILTGPDASQVQQGIESVTGKFYEPKTMPGQYASTVGEFAPSALIPGGGGLAARAVNTVAPALASETAGQYFKGTPAEPYARIAGGMLAGPAVSKAITPMATPASAARQADIALLQGEGIPLSAGQRTGSKSLQWMEANAADMPGSAGRAAEMKAAQDTAYNRAVTSRMFDPTQLQRRGIGPDVNLPDPGAYTAGKQSLKDEYTRLSQNTFQSDPQLHGDLVAARQHYEGNTLPSQRAAGSRDLNTLHNELVDKLVAGQGTMPGSQYQAIRSRFGKLADSSQADPYLAEALQKSQKALDDAMFRGLPPAEAAAWKLNNQRYAVMKDLTPTIAKSGGESLSPQAVAQALRASNPDRYAAQTGVLDPLSRAAANVIKPMPQSGTAARLGMQKLFNVPQIVMSAGAAGAGALTGNPLVAGAAALAPFVGPRVALSRPGQAYLGNQALPQNMRDIIAQELMQQLISRRQ
jgi:hypothetical protein